MTEEPVSQEPSNGERGARSAANPARPWRRGPAAAWALYDLANTIYAATVTYLFTPWFTAAFADTGLPVRTWLGVTTTASMVLAGLCVPVFGAMCDRTGGARRYLVLATLANVAAMMFWGLGGGMAATLATLFVANLAYQTALLFYNALLPSVAPPERHGLLSGIGTGVGYFGNVVVLLTLVLLPPGDGDPVEPYLVAMGLGFLVLALPCMLWVRERRPMTAAPTGRVVRDSLRSTLATLRDLPRHRPLLLFLLGNFFLVDVLNTAIQFFGDYVKQVYQPLVDAGGLRLFGMTFAGDSGLNAFLGVLGLLLSGLAFLFGIALGFWTDRHPLGVMRLSGAMLGLALVGGALFGGGDPVPFVATMVVGGALGLAGIWTAGRKLVLLLAPPDRIGQFFGLYGITVKVSVIGSTVYGVIADGSGPQAALLAQMVQLVLGMTCLLLVRMPRGAVGQGTAS